MASSFRSLEREKGSGTPVDADPYPPHPAVRLAPLQGALACRRSTRGSRQRDFRPQGSASGHASWDAAGAYDPLSPPFRARSRAPLHGRYPRRACPSPVKAPHAPVIVPAGMMPKPPGNGPYLPARGHRTRSAFGSTLGRRRPSLSEICILYNRNGDIVSMESDDQTRHGRARRANGTARRSRVPMTGPATPFFERLCAAWQSAGTSA